MSYKISLTPKFQKEAKRLIKKYPSLQKELFQLRTKISENPFEGTAIGLNCYKIRIAIASKGKDKSGGARVITLVVFTDEEVLLISIYDKSEKENITDKEIRELLKHRKE